MPQPASIKALRKRLVSRGYTDVRITFIRPPDVYLVQGAEPLAGFMIQIEADEASAYDLLRPVGYSWGPSGHQPARVPDADRLPAAEGATPASGGGKEGRPEGVPPDEADGEAPDQRPGQAGQMNFDGWCT